MMKLHFLFIGLVLCSIFSNCTKVNKPRLDGWWEVQGSTQNSRLNTVEWNLKRNRLLHFDNGVVEFLNGVHYFPTRQYGHFSPFKLKKDTLFFYYEPEEQFVGFHIEVREKDKVILSKGQDTLYLKQVRPSIAGNSFKLENIRAVKLSIVQDSLALRAGGDIEIFVNVEKMTVESIVGNSNKVRSQLTSFDALYLIEQLNRIDLGKIAYDVTTSDTETYEMQILAKDEKITLFLGDNTTTPIFINSLINQMRYLGFPN